MAKNKDYKPSAQEQERIADIYNKFQHCWALRKQPFSYFDDMSLEDMINESVKRWTSYLPPRDANDDWRTQVFMPDTRNKILAILSFVAAQRQRAEFYARRQGEVMNKTVSAVLKSLYDYSLDTERGDYKFIMQTLENLVKGTVVVHETYSYIERDVKEIKKYNPVDGSFEYEKKTIVDEDMCIQNLIPLEDFFIPNFYQPDIQKQPYIIIREEHDYENFQLKYGKYKNADAVKAKANFLSDKEGEMYFYENWQERVDEHTVEVVHYYNKSMDVHNIIANGVLITAIDRPIIYDHKDYPVSKTILEPYAPDFFYGMPLPMKIVSEQDVVNTMYNMMLDREYLSIMPFFFTSLDDEIEESSIGPFQRIQVSDTSAIREANIQGIKSSNIKMLDFVRDSISKSTIDDSMMGVVSGGTATAVQQARESATRILGLLLKFMSELTYDVAQQRVQNILQFYATDVIEGTTKEFRAYNQVLSDGTYGMKVVRLVDSKDKMPDQAEVVEMAGESDENVEIHYITPQSLRDIEYDLKIVPASSVEESKSMRKALGMEYVNFLLQAFPDMADRGRLFEMVNELFDQDSERMQRDQAENPQQEMMEQMMATEGGEATDATMASPRMQQLLKAPEQSIAGLAGGQ